MSHPKNLKPVGLQMHDPFLSCCKLWYGTNRICYDFYFKNAKIRSSSMITNTYQGHMAWYSNSNLSHMLLVWALSFVKLLWPMLRFSSCTHDHDTRTPTNKLLTLTLRVTHNMDSSVHHIITPFTLSWYLSLKSFICQKESYGLC
jgi:hypothetical protein